MKKIRGKQAQESSLTEKQAIQLLKRSFGKNNTSFQKVLMHSKAVQKEALRIARKNMRKGISVDIPFLKTSSLLHDIGRSRCLPGTKGSVMHGVTGARLLRSEHLLQHAKVAERHIGAGLTPFEAKKLGLPPGNYIPKTIEEKIITHADNLADGNKIIPFAKTYRRYEEELGRKYAQRLLRLKRQVDR